jgi:hypothetical protein
LTIRPSIGPDRGRCKSVISLDGSRQGGHN